MGDIASKSLITVLAVLLRPIVRFCLKRAVKLQDLMAAAKLAFIEEAKADLARRGMKLNVSRVSVATGMHRQDVAKLLASDVGEGIIPALSYPLDVVARVLNQWQTDDRFLTPAGQPRILTISSPHSLFVRLVQSVSKDMNTATLLFELERGGHVIREGNTVRLERGAFSPDNNAAQGFRIVARDIDDLLTAASQNIEGTFPTDIKNLHARTEFDNIRPERLPEIRAWLVAEGHKLHRATREYLSKFDQDTTPDPTYKGHGIKVSLGTFALVDQGKQNGLERKLVGDKE